MIFACTLLPNLTKIQKCNLLENLNLNVPQSECQAYYTLIEINLGIFSTDNNNLGWANNFKHEIKIESKEPIYCYLLHHDFRPITNVSMSISLMWMTLSLSPYNTSHNHSYAWWILAFTATWGGRSVWCRDNFTTTDVLPTTFRRQILFDDNFFDKFIRWQFFWRQTIGRQVFSMTNYSTTSLFDDRCNSMTDLIDL